MSTSIFRRLRIAAWALLNAERLLSLHFEMLRDVRAHRDRLAAARAHADRNLRLYGREGASDPGGQGYSTGREAAGQLYAAQLRDMPGADDNRKHF